MPGKTLPWKISSGKLRAAGGALFLFLVIFARTAPAQTTNESALSHAWDFGVWVAGETGEEVLNDFTEAQILTAGISVGKVLTGEKGKSWRRGTFEYGMTVFPLFRQFRPQPIYGGGFEPMVLRWNSSVRAGRVSPFIELAGGAVWTNTNLPAGDTSDFNFTARGGGGIRIFSRQRQWTEIGCRWSHISNANLGNKNTEFNGLQVSVGYHWAK
jgi:hypothetical protein